jgi:hypothetical protein
MSTIAASMTESGLAGFGASVATAGSTSAINRAFEAARKGQGLSPHETLSKWGGLRVT